MRRIALLASLAAVLWGPSVVGAQSISPFHLELSGTLPVPFGAYPGSRVTRASDVLDSGGGFAVSASIDVGRHFGVGVRSGMFRDQKERAVSVITFNDTLPGISRLKLSTVPTVALVQYRMPFGARLWSFAEAGAGVMSFTGKRTTATARFTVRSAAYQSSFGYLLGGGAGFDLGAHCAVTATVDFHQAITRDGQVWRENDDPRFMIGSIGIRYPR